MLTPEALGLPSAERLLFPTPPLKLAVCQIRFPAILKISTPAGVAALQEAIQGDYPLLRTESGIALLVEVQGGATHRQDAQQWRFEDVCRRWTVVVSPEFLAIETRYYERFEEFRDRLHRLLVALRAIYRPPLITRIGLRYIDEIRGLHDRRAQWRGVIRDEVLGPLTYGSIADMTVQALQEIQLRADDGEALTLRHGHLPTGTTVIPVADDAIPDDTPFYLLDFDASRTFLPTDALALDEEIILQYVDRYHDLIYRLFRATITEEYAQRLAAGGGA